MSEANAKTSLRTALSALGRDDRAATLIEKNRTSAWFANDAARIDLLQFHEAISKGTAPAYREACALWGGVPLDGSEIGDPVFDEWVGEFRHSTIAYVHRYLQERLARLAEKPGHSEVTVALCELILRIDPTDSDAAERLVGKLTERGELAAAARVGRNTAAALQAAGLPVPRGLNAVGTAHAPAPPHPDPNGVAEKAQVRHHGIPTVALVPPTGSRPAPDLFSFAHSEVMSQLTRYRTLRCFEPLPPTDDQGVPRYDIHHIQLSEGMRHDYKLLLWHHPNRRTVYLRCINTRRGDTVACVGITYDQLQDRQRAEVLIAGAINKIEQDILNDDGMSTSSPFGRWLGAYKELQQFTMEGDQAALSVLEDLARDSDGCRLSLVHSSISAIMLKQRMYSPTAMMDAEGLARAQQGVSRALALDPHEPFNHVMTGWLSIHERDHDRAIPAFERAMALNPCSSRVLVSAAEAYAYSGQVEKGQALAERAMRLAGQFVPQYYYGYLASIAYMSGDADECLRQLDRAPINAGTLLLAIAAHDERGNRAKVAEVRAKLDQSLRRSMPGVNMARGELARWVTRSYVARDDDQRRRMFGSLERAGVAVDPSHV
ncbi:MAG: hypothetical protein AAGF45_11130 [Pseudomonadota bacterium]